MFSFDQLKTIVFKLIDYCQKQDWKGYDPYDALNSPIINILPILNSRWPRIIFTQVLKRSPVNLRPLLRIPKTENPKAIALFVMSFLKLKKIGLLNDNTLIYLMIEKLITLRSPNNFIKNSSKLVIRNLQPVTYNLQFAIQDSTNSINPSNPSNSSNSQYFGWGYSFPWQTRTILVPKNAPNLVCTTFVANALLDTFEEEYNSFALYGSPKINTTPQTFDKLVLEIVKSSADYILNELYWKDSNGIFSFSYPLPSLKTRVHNANLLGSAFLTRVYKITGDKKYLEPALKVAEYSVSKQNEDGSWWYGEDITQRWIDNFHTGYNLCSLKSIIKNTRKKEFELSLKRGFEFYRKSFFKDDCIPKYFHNRVYPIDIHTIAQSIITLINLIDYGKDDNKNILKNILNWTIKNMWNDKGFFYYQSNSFYKNKINYIRWSQAWMIYALSTYLLKIMI